MAQRRPKKSAGCADFAESFRNPKPKPRFDKDLFCKTSAFRRLRSDFLHGDESWGVAVIALLLAVRMALAWVARQHLRGGRCCLDLRARRAGGNARTCPFLSPPPQRDLINGVVA